MRIPEKGLSKEELFQKMESYRSNDQDCRSGQVFSYVYDAGADVDEVGKKALTDFLHESGLDPTAFPSVMQFEVELVRMAATHVKGDENVVGNFTSGGTESIILALKSARDYFRKKKPEITQPEMVLATTAHAAFHKAADYLGIKKVLTDVDGVSYIADVELMRKAITPNTIILIGSAPSYAHGVVDPIEQIGQLALEHDLLFHVDACMGGFLLPYFRRLGEPIPDFEFNVPGVTSLSMDLHKYGYTPKNASIILYKNKELRRHQIYACAAWTGYTIVNNAVQSSKSGGPMAASWAVMNFLGDDGYLALAKNALEATKKIVKAIDDMDDIELMGRPEMTLLCFGSDTVNVFHVADEMKMRGWFLQPQLAFANSKKNVHISVNSASIETVDKMIEDLKLAVEDAKKLPDSDMADQIAAAFAQVDPDSFDDEMFASMLGMAGMTGVDLPERMAEINEVLNALPVPLREKLLVEFLNNLFI